MLICENCKKKKNTCNKKITWLLENFKCVFYFMFYRRKGGSRKSNAVSYTGEDVSSKLKWVSVQWCSIHKVEYTI